MVTMHLGTMGFSYNDWERVFYPDGLPASNYLKHYSKYFNAVEIDSTFYGTPRLSTVKQWAMVTPHDFRICVKTPRKVTHDLMLNQALDDMREFVRTITQLGQKLGVILIQFPPSFTFGRFNNRLADFLFRLRTSPEAGKATRFAVEFRHQSWYTMKTSKMLEKFDVCWAATEYPGLPTDICRTSDFLYIRWIGRHGTYKHHGHEREDKSPQLQQWWGRIYKHMNDVDAVYGFFNNDYSGHAPATCNKFKNIAGLPIKNLKPPQQKSLF